VLCSLAELEATGSRGFSVGAGYLQIRGFVVRGSKGVHAYVNTCPHAGHPLNFRADKFLTPDRNLILCASHGALFTRDDGLCIAGPCPGQSLRRVPVVVVGEYVMLAEGADPDALANAP